MFHEPSPNPCPHCGKASQPPTAVELLVAAGISILFAGFGIAAVLWVVT